MKREDAYTGDYHMAGYILTASPIVYVRFEPTAGTVTGIYQMYGVG